MVERNPHSEQNVIPLQAYREVGAMALGDQPAIAEIDSIPEKIFAQVRREVMGEPEVSFHAITEVQSLEDFFHARSQRFRDIAAKRLTGAQPRGGKHRTNVLQFPPSPDDTP